MSTPFISGDTNSLHLNDWNWKYDGATSAAPFFNSATTFTSIDTGSSFSTTDDLSVLHHWHCRFCGYDVTTISFSYLRPPVPQKQCVCLDLPEIMES